MKIRPVYENRRSCRNERTAADRIVRITRQGGMTPALGLNVLLSGKPRPEPKLHPAVAQRSHVRASRPPLLLSTASAYRDGQVRRVGTNSRRLRAATVAVRTAVQRKRGLPSTSDAYLRDTPLSGSSAALPWGVNPVLPALRHRPGRSVDGSMRPKTVGCQPANAGNNGLCRRRTLSRVERRNHGVARNRTASVTGS